MTEMMMDSHSARARVLFETLLIEALSEGTSEDREQLRSNLVRMGLDDHFARRLLRADIPEIVRASSLLRLLHLKQEGCPEPAAPEKKTATEKA